MDRRKATKTEARIAKESRFANISEKWMQHWQHGKSARHVDSTKRRLSLES